MMIPKPESAPCYSDDRRNINSYAAAAPSFIDAVEPPDPDAAGSARAIGVGRGTDCPADVHPVAELVRVCVRAAPDYGRARGAHERPRATCDDRDWDRDSDPHGFALGSIEAVITQHGLAWRCAARGHDRLGVSRRGMVVRCGMGLDKVLRWPPGCCITPHCTGPARRNGPYDSKAARRRAGQ